LRLDLLTHEEDMQYSTRVNISRSPNIWHPQSGSAGTGRQKAAAGRIVWHQHGRRSRAATGPRCGRGVAPRPDLAGIAAMGQVHAWPLLIVGGNDADVLESNKIACHALRCEKRLEGAAGATHLFEEANALGKVAEIALGCCSSTVLCRRPCSGLALRGSDCNLHSASRPNMVTAGQGVIRH
jgi:hypothetical protein